MSGPTTCRICSGPTRLLYSGTAAGHSAEGMSPSCHTPGAYGDLYRCDALPARCSSRRFPRAADLHDLYREMDDEAYLAEAAGRRATAGRLLDLIGRYRAGGRLLDVGCGHGLLADEARNRGWEVARASSCRPTRPAYARERLGLEVHEKTLDDFAATSPGQFDAIVLADVIEHLDDPGAAIDRCLRAARARRRAAGRHARPGLDDRAPRRSALVGLPARAHLPAAAQRRCASCCPRAAS